MLGLGNKVTTSKGQVNASDIPPIVVLYDATDITDTSVTLSGAYSSSPTATARGFEYDTNEDFSTKTTVSLAAGIPYSTSITGLTDNTIYYYRFYATNSVGTTISAAKSFTSAKAAGSGSPSNSDWEVFHQYDFTLAVQPNGEVDGINFSSNYGLLASNQDGVTDDNGVSKDDCLLASKGLTDTDSLQFLIVSDVLTGVDTSSRYKIEFDMLVPSSTDQHGGLYYINFFGQNYFSFSQYTDHWEDENGNSTFYYSTDKGTWKHIILDKLDDTASSSSFAIRVAEISGGATGVESDSELYLKDLTVYKYIGS